ncbi:MAG: restriction endonuclease subunit S [Planctomycetia bacterium]|nr:restriction endonuclease subunit S [Planctomycetia bacterium]
MSADPATVAITDVAEVNPPLKASRPPASARVSFIPMADVSDSGEWVNKQSRHLGEIGAGYTPFQEHDILFAKITPCMENGKGTFAVGLESGVGFGSTEFHVLRAKPGNQPRFVYHVTQWEALRRKAESMMIGSAGQQRVAAEFFSRFRIPRLDGDQQHQIADILDAADAAIRQTGALISKLRWMKTGLLHDLLTRGLDEQGRLREPVAHPKQFRECTLGELTPLRRDRGYPGLPTMAVTMYDGLLPRNTHDRRVETRLLPEQHLLARKGDIAYNMMRMWQGACGLADEDCLLSPAYVVVVPTGVVPAFAYLLFKLPDTIQKFHNRSRGLTDDRLRLYHRDFARIVVRIPRSLSEQQAIVDVVQAHDARIRAEEAYRDKLKLQKRGLMNDLLTGWVRV